VLELADRLRADGIDASIDQYEPSPPQGWPAWCEAEIREADFVLMVCTETYLRRLNREEEAGKGFGVLWEARLVEQHLYDAASASEKFVPVLFADGSSAHVPTPLRGASIYRVDTPEGYEALYRLLTDQPRVRRPELGQLRRLPERQRQPIGALPTVNKQRAEAVLQTEEMHPRAEADQWVPPPMEMPEGAIFISCAREDLAAARTLERVLEAAGLTVWFNVDPIAAGDILDLKIHHNIQHSPLFLALLSRNTEARTEGFFRREWHYALDRDLCMAEGNAVHHPGGHDETSQFATLPARFREILITRLPGGHPTPEFIDQLKGIISRR